MIKKTCVQCGKPFKAFKPEFDICPDCKNPKSNAKSGGDTMQRRNNYSDRGRGNPPRQEGGRGNDFEPLKREFLLDSLFTESGSIRPEVYQTVSKGIAEQFSKVDITRSAIRRFFEVVRTASEQYQWESGQIDDPIKEKLNRLLPLAHYSQQRKVTKQCFTDFMNHYINLATKDPKNLRGFKELFMSVVAYLQREN